MEFEVLDEELEDLLHEIIDKTDECSGCASGIEFYSPEYRELKELGYFEVVSEYMDGTALIRPKRKALKYFTNKSEWEKQTKVNTAKSVGGKIADKAVDVAADFTASVIAKMSGM